MMILSKPLFIWFGILGFISIIITAILGYKLKVKIHKKMAVIAIILLIFIK